MAYTSDLGVNRSRNWDARSILVGGVAQGAGLTALAVFGLPGLAKFAVFFLGTALTAKLSRSYGREFADAVAAAALGALLNLPFVLALVYFNTSGAGAGAQTDTTFLVFFTRLSSVWVDGMVGIAIALVAGFFFGSLFRE